MQDKPLCQAGKYSCFGCCGRRFKRRDAVLEDIKRNTRNLKTKDFEVNKKELLHLCQSGVCKGVVIKDDKFICGYHPVQHNGTDHRDRLCDKEYNCKAYYYYHQVWDDSLREKFLRFLDQQKANWFEYSINMDNGKFLQEFLAREGSEQFIKESQELHQNENTVHHGSARQ
ncbi:hypothetical protein HZB01_03210 [Candidatus Woesearchaeota archaeon]|nr:hypothetical protein [Candidatus Woesearchaeota archaeon]